MPTPDQDNPVCIVGGGWAGLSAAVELSRNHIPVLLLESSYQLGGRARTIHIGDLNVDNGQHLMIGAYTELWSFLESIDVNLHDHFHKRAFSLEIYDKSKSKTKSSLNLSCPRLPAPWNMLFALIFARGLSIGDRLRCLQFSRHWRQLLCNDKRDYSVATLLNQEKQSDTLVKLLWEPLCIASLNTSIHEASAQLFLKVLLDSLLSTGGNDLYFPKSNLSELLPEPCHIFLQNNGADIFLGKRVNRLHIEDNKIHSIETDTTLETQHLILATPHSVTNNLLRPYQSMSAIFDNLDRLHDEPVYTLYLQYFENVQLTNYFVGLTGCTAQWIFDRRVCGQPGLIAAVISNSGEHTGWSETTLIDTIIQELANCFPNWPAPTYTKLIREKRATFASKVGVNSIRPTHQTTIKGVWLAGDYTNTGLPGTLESAIRSGTQCAHEMLNSF